MQKSGNPGSVVWDCLKRNCEPEARIGIGLSGGMDSVALLNALLECGFAPPERILAIHVHHGLSPSADEWMQFCHRLCADRGIQFVVRKVRIPKGDRLGLEGAARKARYQALASHAIDVLLLAHHRDDQAETVLLQLLRGSGVKGLAAMPEVRLLDPGLRILRPFLGLSRRSIKAYVEERGLKWVDDESNGDDKIRRNFLRLHVLPVLERGFPGASESMASVAANLADARLLLDQLAESDLENLVEGEALQVRGLLALGMRRARNAFVHWLALRGVAVPSRHAIDEALRQLETAAPASQFRMVSGRDVICRYRYHLYHVQGEGASVSPPRAWQLPWDGEDSVVLPGRLGTLRFSLRSGGGISATRLAGTSLMIKGRTGGEKLCIQAQRPRRAIKKLFQEHGFPHWLREQVPFLWHGGELVAVPGLGIAADWQARSDEAGWEVVWEPA